MTNFSELNISESTLRSIKRMGFEEATPIQEGTISFAMAGREVLGQAQTGTGKTANNFTRLSYPILYSSSDT